MLPAQPNQSLIDGLAVLEAVMAADEPVGGRELSRDLGLNRTRVNRLLMTLAHLGLLDRTEAGKYESGAGMHVLAALGAHSSGLLQAALPGARAWRERGFSFTLGVLWRGRLCQLLHARPELPFDSAVGGRGLVPPEESAAGLALALSLPALGERLRQTPVPVQVAAPSLAEVLAQGRARGHVVLPFRDGTISVGVPVGDPPRAGLSVSRRDLDGAELRAVAAELQEEAAGILRELRHPRRPRP